MMAVLRVIKGPNPDHVYELGAAPVFMGRNPDADIVLDHDAISRPHAKIEMVGADYFLEDLNSLNGTSVNGQPLPRGKRGRRRLEEGDRVKICGFQLEFQPDPSSKSSMVLMVDERAANAKVMSTINVGADSSDLVLSEHAEARLRALLAIMNELAHTIELRDALPKILDGLFRIFRQAQRGFISLRESPNSALTPKAVKRSGRQSGPIQLSRTIVDEVTRCRSAILSHDASRDERFSAAKSVADANLRSVMCVPLLSTDDEVMGVVELDVIDTRGSFAADDLKVLAVLARQLAIIIENAELHEFKLRQQQTQSELIRIEHDLEVARKVQRGLLPQVTPVINGYRFYDVYHPAEQVGGDYYDYIHLPNQRLAVVVADVAGDGIPAALLMARFAGETRHYLVTEPTPTAAITRLNESFTQSGQEGRFITLVVAVIDLNDHTVTVVNAGHRPPQLCRENGQVEEVALDEAQFPLGWFEDATYNAYTFKLQRGECLAMFTDGIEEAFNFQNELYGLPRIQEILGSYSGDVRALGQQLFDDVKRFVGDQPRNDDMCLVCLGRVRD